MVSKHYHLPGLFMERSGTSIIQANPPSGLATNLHTSLSHDVHKSKTSWAFANLDHIRGENKVSGYQFDFIFLSLPHTTFQMHQRHANASLGKLHELAVYNSKTEILFDGRKSRSERNYFC